MWKLTLVNVYYLNVKFDFFVYLLYDYKGELDLKNIDIVVIIQKLKDKLKTDRSINPLIVVGSHRIFPKEKKS